MQTEAPLEPRRIGFDYSLMEVATCFIGVLLEINVIISMWIRPFRSYSHWDAVLTPLCLCMPLVLGIIGLRELSKFKASGEISANASKQIRSTISFLVFITYIAIFSFSDLAFRR